MRLQREGIGDVAALEDQPDSHGSAVGIGAQLEVNRNHRAVGSGRGGVLVAQHHLAVPLQVDPARIRGEDGLEVLGEAELEHDPLGPRSPGRVEGLFESDPLLQSVRLVEVPRGERCGGGAILVDPVRASPRRARGDRSERALVSVRDQGQGHFPDRPRRRERRDRDVPAERDAHALGRVVDGPLARADQRIGIVRVRPDASCEEHGARQNRRHRKQPGEREDA